MKLKQFIKNSTKLSNLWYVIQGYYKVFIQREYDKYYDDRSIDDLMFKAATCPECYMKGECIVCGCEIKAMFKSSKPCPNGKF